MRSAGKDRTDFMSRHAVLLRHHARVCGFDTRQRHGLSALPVPLSWQPAFWGRPSAWCSPSRDSGAVALASSLPQFFLVGVSWPAEHAGIPTAGALNWCQRQRDRRYRPQTRWAQLWRGAPMRSALGLHCFICCRRGAGTSPHKSAIDRCSDRLDVGSCLRRRRQRRRRCAVHRRRRAQITLLP